jgi:hypothetical protein
LLRLEYRKQEQSGKENQLVEMTKKLRIKANELKKKEDVLKARQASVIEGEEFW